jgi:hypothetical protein
VPKLEAETLSSSLELSVYGTFAKNDRRRIRQRGNYRRKE